MAGTASGGDTGKRERGDPHHRFSLGCRARWLRTAARALHKPFRRRRASYIAPANRYLPLNFPQPISNRRPAVAAQYAFVMKDMTKTFPGAPKPVLSNINLQFYQGAKIGIVGPNGAGKSTLMKIMAGIDKDFTGEAWPGENITVGYLRAGAAARSDQDRAGERQGRRARRSPTWSIASTRSRPRWAIPRTTPISTR